MRDQLSCFIIIIIPVCLITWGVKPSQGLNFVREPSDVIAAAGQPLWWHCSGQGTGGVTYRWRFNDADVTLPDYRVLSNGTLHISSVSSSSVGSYQCVISDGQNTQYSSAVSLQLAYLASSYSLNPSNQNKNVGDTVVFDCAISSLPPASISWLLSRKPITKGTVSMVTSSQSRLTINNVDYDSQGEYVCVAVNPVIQNTGRYSNTATLTLEGRPGFLVSPSPQSVPQGHSAHFNCVAVGTEPLTVQWYDVSNASSAELLQNGPRYTILSNGSLTVNTVRLSDAGFYMCQATNSRGRNAVTVLLTVTDPVSPPSFTKVPSDMAVQEGEDVTMQCAATGIPEPVISWVKHQSSFPADRTQHIFHGTIKITNVQSSDSGQYICQASNSQGTVDHRVTLTVQVKPYFTQVPVDTDVRQGESSTLFCKAQGTPDPTITWRLPSGEILTADSGPVSGVSVDSSGSVIIMSAADVHHGTFTCYASNLVGTVSTSADLTVLSPPTFTIMPSQQNVVEGADAIFNCQATGRPQPTITWYKIGQSQQIQDGGSYQLFRNGSLKIMGVKRNEAWIYRCLASNSLGNQTAVAPLAVTVLPTVNVTPAEYIVDLGQVVTFHCVTTGDPQPLVRWERDGRTLVLDSNMQLFANNTLVIQSVRVDQLGEYTCVATSSVSTVSDSGVIFTRDVPKFHVPPSNVTVNVTDTAALHCSATAREQPTYSWYTADAQGTLGRMLGQGSGQGSGQGATIYVDALGNLWLQNIEEGSEGWYACVARNSVGNTTGLAYVTINVPPRLLASSSSLTVPSGQPVTMQCFFTGKPSLIWKSPGGSVISRSGFDYQLNSSSLHIVSSNVSLHWGTWTCRACNLLGCVEGMIQLSVEGPPAIRGVTATETNSSISLSCITVGTPAPQVQYFIQQVQIFPVSPLVGHTVSTVDGSSRLVVEKQHVFSSYTCRVNNGHGTVNVVLTVPGPPTAPYALAVTSSTVQLSWIADHSGQLPLTGYKVQFRQVQPVLTTEWTDVEGIVGTTELPYLVTGMVPFASFEFRVRSRNILGYGDPSEASAIVNTLDGAPGLPSDVTVETKQNSIIISWSRPVVLNGYAENIAYQLTYTNLNTSASKTYETNQAEPLRLVIENLDYESTYEVRLRAGNTRLAEGGWGEYVTKTVTLKELVPTLTPEITEATPRGPDAIVVHWKLSQNGSHDKVVIAYAEVYKSAFTTIRLNQTTSGNYAVTGLQAGTVYQVRAAMYNNAGVGPYSDVTIVETGPALFSQVGYKDQQLLTTGTIIGIIGGCLGGLLLVLLLILICSQQRRLREKEKSLGTKKSDVKMNPYVDHDTSNLEFDDTVFNTVNSRTSGIRGFYDFQGDHTHDVSTDTAYTVGRNTSVQGISVKPQRSDIVYKSDEYEPLQDPLDPGYFLPQSPLFSLAEEMMSAVEFAQSGVECTTGYYNPVVEEEPLGEHTEIELDTTKNSVNYLEPAQTKKKQNGVLRSLDRTGDSLSSHEYAEVSPRSERSSRCSGQDEPDTSLYAVVNKNSKLYSPEGSLRSRDMSSQFSTPSKEALGKLVHSKPKHRISISKDDSALPDKHSNDKTLLIEESKDSQPDKTEATLPPVKFSQYVSRSLGSRFPKKNYAFPPLDSNIFLAPEEYEKVATTKEKEAADDNDDDDDIFDPDVVHKGSNLEFEHEGDTTLESEDEELIEEEEEEDEEEDIKRHDAVLF